MYNDIMRYIKKSKICKPLLKNRTICTALRFVYSRVKNVTGKSILFINIIDEEVSQEVFILLKPLILHFKNYGDWLMDSCLHIIYMVCLKY